MPEQADRDEIARDLIGGFPVPGDPVADWDSDDDALPLSKATASIQLSARTGAQTAEQVAADVLASVLPPYRAEIRRQVAELADAVLAAVLPAHRRQVLAEVLAALRDDAAFDAFATRYGNDADGWHVDRPTRQRVWQYLTDRFDAKETP